MNTIRFHHEPTVACRLAALAGRDDTAFLSILGTLVLLWAVAIRLIGG